LPLNYTPFCGWPSTGKCVSEA